MGEDNNFEIHYEFTFDGGTKKEFKFTLNKDTMLLQPPLRDKHPDWTKLSHHKCENCPLEESESPQCPIAVNLVDPIEAFKMSVSHNQVDVEITTDNRTYKKRTDYQYGLSSLFGIYMVTSGCPIMDKLRPMVRTHLPFATMDETIYRTLSMYLLAQYFLKKNGKTPDWEMKNLTKIYDEIMIVNRCFLERLSDLNIQDAALNAIVGLDSFAQFTNMLLEGSAFNEIERLFKSYLDPKT